MHLTAFMAPPRACYSDSANWTVLGLAWILSNTGHCIASHTVCVLAQILRKLVENHLHRLYIVDEATKPVGVVTLTDILRVVTDQSK